MCRAVPVSLPGGADVHLNVRRWQAHMKSYSQNELKNLPASQQPVKVVAPEEPSRKEVRSPPLVSPELTINFFLT